MDGGGKKFLIGGSIDKGDAKPSVAMFGVGIVREKKRMKNLGA